MTDPAAHDLRELERLSVGVMDFDRVMDALPDLLAVVRAAETYEAMRGFEHHWRCEYRTAAKGWKHGNPPVIDCQCGADDLSAALSLFYGSDR